MDDFPPLQPAQASLSMEEWMAKVDKELKETKEDLVSQRKLLLPFCERELLILAAEILKWAVKEGVEDGNGLHHFDPNVAHEVLLACRAYSGKLAPRQKDVKEFQNMSAAVITLRNNMAHYQTIEALEGMVAMAEGAIQQWPQLVEKYPQQVQIVQKYKTFKQLLKDSFQ